MGIVEFSPVALSSCFGLDLNAADNFGYDEGGDGGGGNSNVVRRFWF